MSELCKSCGHAKFSHQFISCGVKGCDCKGFVGESVSKTTYSIYLNGGLSFETESADRAVDRFISLTALMDTAKHKVELRKEVTE